MGLSDYISGVAGGEQLHVHFANRTVTADNNNG